MDEGVLKQKYHELSKQLFEIGFLCKGSIMRVYLTCGKPNCRCKTDEKAKHGPYNVWTRKVKGKTVTRYLSDRQIELCRQFIKNSNKLELIIEKMRDLSAKLLETEK